jgi:D-glycero-D-manno-heptose 1,7-bisphosphate phosphatase
MHRSMKGMVPALFLDRDGVVNSEVGYLYKPEHVQFMPGLFDLCRVARSRGCKIVIVTNQAGIARGLYSEADFHVLMRWIIGQFARERIQVDGYYFCPHHPEQAIGRYRKDCPDRKPQPGMILRAAREHEIDLARSLLVGDRCSDIQAGATAGVGHLILLTGTEPGPCKLAAHHIVVSTLAEVSAFISSEAVSN